MESKPVRMVNVVPISKLKKVPLPEDDEDSVLCSICSKTFASEIALKNHGRIEHIDALLQDICVRKPPKVFNNKKFTEEQKQEVKMRTELLVSSMEPTDIMTMASADVSYIIIKNGEDGDNKELDGERKSKRRKIEKEKPIKMVIKKETKPITGPFECLQPSNLVSGGTCHQMFFSCCEYSIHFRDEHTRRRKGIKCQVCEKPLRGAGEGHMPYTCQFCGAGFERSGDLSDHTSKTHLKLKPYHCTICNKRFSQQGGLQQHMRAHTGDRPFTCTYCPKAFTQKSGLDQHLRIHTKYKPYKCVICSKSFCQSVHLQQHMRTHTNVAPFQCIVCQKRFKQSSHLNYHLKYHNPLNMTNEQKTKYMELMKMMGKEGIFELVDQTGDNENMTANRQVLVENGQEIGEYKQELTESGDGLVEKTELVGNLQDLIEEGQLLENKDDFGNGEDLMHQEQLVLVDESQNADVYIVSDDWAHN